MILTSKPHNWSTTTMAKSIRERGTRAAELPTLLIIVRYCIVAKTLTPLVCGIRQFDGRAAVGQETPRTMEIVNKPILLLFKRVLEYNIPRTER